MRLSPPSVSLRAAVLALLLGVFGQGTTLAADPKASRLYEDALQRFEKSDHAGAIVQLKNALQIDKNMLPVHVLLGKALLARGDVRQAEVALVEALRLGVNRAEVAVPLAKAVIGQGKPDVVLADARFTPEGLPPATRYELLLLRAGAAADVGDLRTALQSVNDARALDTTASGSWISEVPIRIRARQYREALAAAERAVALAPDLAEAHYSRGEAQHIVPDLNGALASYDRALSIDPNHVASRVARAGIHVDQNRLDAALRDLAAVEKVGGGDPRGLYLKAVIAERQGRTAEARSALNELTGLLDAVPPEFLRYQPQTQMLGGMAHHGLGQREKARPYLESVLRAYPGHAVAKVLANIYMADRNVDSAIEVLGSYSRANPADRQALVLLASAHMAQGRHGRATQIMQDALKQGDQPLLRTTLGLSLVGGARYGDAVKELEAAFAKDPRSLPAGYALASLYTQAGQGRNAVRVAEAVNRAHPRNAGVLALLGSARRTAGDAAGARSALQAARQADPSLVAALQGLARLDMDAGSWAGARERLTEALALDEKNLQTLLNLAELAERSGQLDDAQRWLTRANEAAGPNDAGPALALVDLHLRYNQLEAAREAVAGAVGKAPDTVATLVATARVSLARGELSAARTSLVRAATSAGYNVPQLVQIAALQGRAGAYQAAAHSLDKALQERPDHMPALTQRAEVDIRLGDLAAAEQRARQIIAKLPRAGIGHTLMGDIASARGQRDAALASYRQAHNADRSTESLLKLFAAMVPRDRTGAIRLAEQWLGAHPKDAIVWRALADTQLVAGNLPAARRSYETLLTAKPDDADAINNLANILIQQNDPGALRLAERALAVSPGAAHIIGTVGWAAFKAGQTDRAVQLLRDARLRDPANADTRFFLGSVLASQGRKGEAREELVAAVQPGAGGSHRAAAEELLATLR